MKILYAIQGTGNGHLTRAKEIIPILQQKGDLDILLSGNENNIPLGYDVKYNLKGLNFTFGKNGGIDCRSFAVDERLRSGCLHNLRKHLRLVCA